MQHLWQKKYDWDEILCDEDIQKWQKIAQDVEIASKIEILRQYFKSTSTKMDDVVLHIFTDASLKAYGATTYLSQNNETALVMAKTRVAPVKGLTLPKLELMAAVIGSRLSHVQASFKIAKTVYWS